MVTTCNALKQRITPAFFTHTISDFFNKGDDNVGRTKLGNANAQRNNNRKKAMKSSSELVEFETGEDLKRNRPRDK